MKFKVQGSEFGRFICIISGKCKKRFLKQVLNQKMMDVVSVCIWLLYTFLPTYIPKGVSCHFRMAFECNTEES